MNDKTLNFGEYKGKTIEYIFIKDYGWLHWAMQHQIFLGLSLTLKNYLVYILKKVKVRVHKLLANFYISPFMLSQMLLHLSIISTYIDDTSV